MTGDHGEGGHLGLGLGDVGTCHQENESDIDSVNDDLDMSVNCLRWRIWWAGGCGCQARAAAGRLLQEPVGGRDQLLRISLAWLRLAMHNVSHQKAGVEEASEELNFFNYTRRII